MSSSDFGLVGLAVMGQNLVLNVESRGFNVSVFNRTASTMQEFVAGEAAGKNIQGFETMQEFVASLKRPRKVMIMVKAGPAVDAVIAPAHAAAGGGRSDHRRRELALHRHGAPLYRGR